MSGRLAFLTRLVLVTTMSVGAAAPAAADTQPQVRFANSCAPGAQADLHRGLTLLHSFEYPESQRVFAGVIDRHPDCVLARWGAAMSLWHPLWAPPSEAELAAGAAHLTAADGLARSPREAAYLAALATFFSSTDPATHARRAAAYEQAMSQVYADHLDDPEAAVFYALALLSTADPRDKSYAHQYKAAALLGWVAEEHPRHPGVLHYLIHSYDFPGLAHLGLGAATRYAEAAPDSAHAQHMPSHIFTRLGLWDRSIASNLDSTHSADAYTRRAHLPGHYDEGLHSIDYLMYALLQTARDSEAKVLLDGLGRIEKTEPENFKVAYTYAASPARYALERRRWREASELRLIRADDFPWEGFGWARAIHHFARGLGAARDGQAEAAARELAILEDLAAALPATTLPYWREEVRVQVDVVRSWIRLGEGAESEALDLARAAAVREDAVDKHPVTPGEVLPARELYADMLLEVGRHDEALREYRAVLHRSPNRLNALLGAAAAAGRAGDLALEEEYRAKALRQTRRGDCCRGGGRGVPAD